MPDSPSLITEIQTPSPTTERKLLLQRFAALVLAVAITAGIIAMRGTINRYATYGYPGIFLISLLGNATLIFPAPSIAIVFAVGGALNSYLVGIAAGLGSSLGEMTGYLAGIGGRAVLENRRYYQPLATLMKRWGAWIIFFLALIPNPLFDFGGIMAGTLKMPWWKFLAAAIAGKTLRYIFLAFLGASFFGA